MQFGNYSQYYDLIYKDKDYQAESNYIKKLIQTHHPAATSLIDFGCGTGRHDFYFAENYQVIGVDRSASMLAEASQNLANSLVLLNKIKFVEGDIRSVFLSEQADVCISLFHVMSYQTTNDDLQAVFQNVKRHLKSNGLFIFDCWYGPGVLTDLPSVRVRHFQDANQKITRISQPTHHFLQNTIDIDYLLLVREFSSEKSIEIQEMHSMRYLFYPEIQMLSEINGFDILIAHPWMSKEPLMAPVWNACFVLRAKN